MRRRIAGRCGPVGLGRTAARARQVLSVREAIVNIYIGNLSYSVTSEDLQAAFAAHGEVLSANVIMDRETGRSKGFGFVEMPNSDEGLKAIQALNEQPLSGRNIRVNEAKPREPRPPRRSRY
nr:RNA-binding protein [Ferrimonas balearica]